MMIKKKNVGKWREYMAGFSDIFSTLYSSGYSLVISGFWILFGLREKFFWNECILGQFQTLSKVDWTMFEGR